MSGQSRIRAGDMLRIGVSAGSASLFDAKDERRI
jgi:hypothetical protein